MQADRLKAKLKLQEERHEEPSRVRLHRAISWLRRAEAETEDLDAQFIFLWIAFNAAYASEFGPEQSERDRLAAFFNTLVTVDDQKRLHALAFEKFSGPIRTMIGNKFVFEPFWRALREHDSSNRWEEQFEASRKAALKAIMDGSTGKVLGVIFDRLYVLRNQLIHGGATWNSRVNRAQVKDGAHLLSAVVPLMLELMLEHPDVDFGAILYPVV